MRTYHTHRFYVTIRDRFSLSKSAARGNCAPIHPIRIDEFHIHLCNYLCEGRKLNPPNHSKSIISGMRHKGHEFFDLKRYVWCYRFNISTYITTFCAMQLPDSSRTADLYKEWYNAWFEISKPAGRYRMLEFRKPPGSAPFDIMTFWWWKW